MCSKMQKIVTLGPMWEGIFSYSEWRQLWSVHHEAERKKPSLGVQGAEAKGQDQGGAGKTMRTRLSVARGQLE